MKLILALPAVGLLFTGLAISPRNSHNSPYCAQEPPTQERPALWVDKSECFRDESFELHFKLPHPTTLGVVAPDGHFFYLVFPAECTSGKLTPLVSSETFSQMRSLTIFPSTLKADPYQYGVLENQPVFTRSGTYRFILGENLHVDDESALNMVSVQYNHKKRPAPQTAPAATSAALVRN